MRAQVDSVCTGDSVGRCKYWMWQFKVHPVAVARFRLGV